MSLILIHTDRFGDHRPPPGHPERVERAEVMHGIAAAWKQRGRIVQPPRPATHAELRRVHSDAHLSAIDGTAGPGGVARPRHLHVSRLARRRAAGRRRGDWRRRGDRAVARDARIGAGSAAGPSRRARSGDGILPVQQRGGRGSACADARHGAGRRSWITTCIMATARSGSFTRIRACCTSRRISIRSIRAPAQPTMSGGAKVRASR